jgi:transposase
MPFPGLTRERLQNLQRKAVTKRDLQRVQCLVFRQFGCPSHDAGVFTGMSAVSVRRVWSDWQKKGEEGLFGDGRGGRYNENMTEEEEKEFLSPFLQEAEKGGVLVVHDVHRAYEKKMGRKIPTSTIYAMLHRCGWRKIVPQPSHPQGDPIAREKFQATFPPDRSARGS